MEQNAFAGNQLIDNYTAGETFWDTKGRAYAGKSGRLDSNAVAMLGTGHRVPHPKKDAGNDFLNDDAYSEAGGEDCWK